MGSAQTAPSWRRDSDQGRRCGFRRRAEEEIQNASRGDTFGKETLRPEDGEGPWLDNSNGNGQVFLIPLRSPVSSVVTRPSSCRPASTRQDRADHRKIRKLPKAMPRPMNLSPKRQIPTAVVRASFRGISGTRPCLCRKPAPRTDACIPCRCTRRWACAAPNPTSIRIDLWTVRKLKGRPT